MNPTLRQSLERLKDRKLVDKLLEIKDLIEEGEYQIAITRLDNIASNLIEKHKLYERI